MCQRFSHRENIQKKKKKTMDCVEEEEEEKVFFFLHLLEKRAQRVAGICTVARTKSERIYKKVDVPSNPELHGWGEKSLKGQKLLIGVC